MSANEHVIDANEGEARLDLGGSRDYHGGDETIDSAEHLTAGLLLDHGCDVGRRDVYGRTALWYTSTIPYMEKLVSCGLDINAKDMNGRTILHHAIGTKSKEARTVLIATLLRLGAVNLRTTRV